MSDFAPTQHPWWVAVTQVLNQRTVLRCSVCVLLFFLVSLTGRRAACSPPVVFAQSTAWYAETSWSLRCDSKAAAHRERWNPLQNHRTRNTSAVVGHVFGTLAYTDAIKQHIKCATFSTINLFKIEVRATDTVLFWPTEKDVCRPQIYLVSAHIQWWRGKSNIGSREWSTSLNAPHHRTGHCWWCDRSPMCAVLKYCDDTRQNRKHVYHAHVCEVENIIRQSERGS